MFTRWIKLRHIFTIVVSFIVAWALFQTFFVTEPFSNVPFVDTIKETDYFPTTEPTPPAINYLANISEPYHHILVDKGFQINRTYFSLRDTQVSTIIDDFSILGSGICKNRVKTLYIVPSVVSTSAAKDRLEIRQTWASDFYNEQWQQHSSTSRVAFFFGDAGLNPEQRSALIKESAEYGDIVVAQFHDTYKNLSLKMAVSISWAAVYCPDAENVVKVDMDTYVNVNVLTSLIDKLPSQETPIYIYGYQHAYTHPLVVRSGDWAVGEDVYPFDLFPRYIYGHSYVLSGSAVRLMSSSFPYFPIVPNEDAFITGVLAVTLNITRFYHNSFAFSLEKRSFCNMVNNYYASAITKRENRVKLFDAFQNNECSDESL